MNLQLFAEDTPPAEPPATPPADPPTDALVQMAEQLGALHARVNELEAQQAALTVFVLDELDAEEEPPAEPPKTDEPPKKDEPPKDEPTKPQLPEPPKHERHGLDFWG